MSTRGSVAWNIHGFIIGVYNHFDSYPSQLGRQVWHYAKELGLPNLIKRLRQVGDWEEFLSGGVCEYCGKVAGQAQSIMPSNFNCQRNLETGRFPEIPDPEARYHEHGNSSKDQFEPFKNGLFMEWVYVLDEATNCIEVWMSVPQYRLYKYRNLGMITTDIFDDHDFTHVLFKRFNVDEDVPNWDFVYHEARILKETIANDDVI